jgi:hypothetical protein
VSDGGAPRAASASAPGRIELAGSGDGPRLSVALDRRALCRVAPAGDGLLLESKDLLTRTAAADRDELLSRSSGSVVAHVLALLEAPAGLHVVTEWKLFQGSGVDGDGALALAATGALARALGRPMTADELLALAKRAAAAAGLEPAPGPDAALRGGLVRSETTGGSATTERLEVDPGRIDECLRLVDAGSSPAETPPAEPEAAADRGLVDAVVDGLRAGRYEELVEVLRREGAGLRASPAQRSVAAIVNEAGGAARPLPSGRLVAVWAPPGERGPGRREAVEAALQKAGLRPLAVRVDLRGLELE